MKNLTFRMVITACFVCCALAVNAKDVYVSATGDDEKDGLSEATAKKTLTGIDAIIEIGDVINVSGLIDIDAEPDPQTDVEGRVTIKDGVKAGFFFKGMNKWKGIQFVGKDNTKDGFSANNNSRLFIIDGGTHRFDNLYFTKARVLYSDGGNAFWLRNGTITFTDCIFEGNTAARKAGDPTQVDKTNGRGGVMRILGGTVNLDKCLFSGNDNKQGGALFVEGGTVNITNSTIEDHDLSTLAGSTGGAIYLWTGAKSIDLNIDNTLFKGNKAIGTGGAIAMVSLTNSDRYVKMNISNTAFIGNVGQRGGAIILNNVRPGTSEEVLIKNTTFFGNHATADGGTICLWASQPGSSFTMVNCTVAGNTTDGNAGHGAGVVSMNNTDHPTVNLLKRFYNCIFDSNYSYSGGENFSDLWLRSAPGEDRLGNPELEMKNCYVSWAGTTANDATYPNNLINYSTSTQVEGEEPVLTYVNAAGLVDRSDIDYYGSNYSAVPLEDDASARLFGDATYLTQFGIEATDQFGKARTVVDGKCAVGAIEITVDEFDNGSYDVFPPLVTSLESSQADALDFLVIQNNTLSLNSGDDATFVIYNLAGAKVKVGGAGMSVSDLPEGVYIVKAKSDLVEFVQKIIK